GEVIQEFTLTKWVHFGKEISNLPIVGAAGKITVAIGDNDKMVRFIVPQRTFEEVEEKQLLPVQDAIANLQGGRGGFEHTESTACWQKYYHNKRLFGLLRRLDTRGH
ncbi:MAG: hypothetical protein U9O65_08570, partial [Thermotogota bacterium]|nr:hypothetical protein [Thermotogota bacterium]